MQQPTEKPLKVWCFMPETANTGQNGKWVSNSPV